MRVDMHMHTMYSDGIYTPEHVIELCKESALDIVAITDHDNIDGTRLVESDASIHIIRGVEVTTSANDYGIEGMLPVELHVLGYGIDIGDTALSRRLDERQRERNACIAEFLHEIQRYGIYMDIDDVPVYHGRMVQIPDLARILDTVLSPESPEYIDIIARYRTAFATHNIPIEDTIHLIHEAGGIAVWAHPFITYYASHANILERDEISSVLDQLIRLGIDGIEVNYLRFDESQHAFLHDLAQRHDLIISAGSDFHGYEGRDIFQPFDSNEISPILRRLGV